LERNDAVAAYSNVFDLELDGSEGRKEFYDKRKDRKNKKMLAEYFEHSSGHKRAAGFFLCSTPFYLIYALFRSETTIPVLCQLQPICACDWIEVFEILLQGKFIHSSETQYIRRNNHPNDTSEEYMKRITAKTENIVGYKMFWPMVEIVLKHFAEYNDHAISVYQKWNLYWEIEEYLRKQYHFYKKIEIPNMKQELPFGYLCYHKITSPFKKLLKLSFKIIRKIYRILLKIKITFFNLFTNKIDK
jgi:hypothetical protein